MYENISYAELKKLPSEQKPNAWKELKTLYKTQKELAYKLGVSPGLVYAMISRYAKGENAENKAEESDIVGKPQKVKNRVGRRKLQLLQEQEEQEQHQNKQEQHQNKHEQEQQNQGNTVNDTNTAGPEVKAVEESDSFNISIRKIVSGEDAQFFLNGVGSTLLKNQKYFIEVKIKEKLL